MKITSEEIAKLAHVSRSTVSRVINNYSNVPEETRRRVMEVIERYGYEPHSSARVLAGKANKVIVLCISEFTGDKKRWKGTGSRYLLRLVGELVSQANLYGYITSIFVLSGKNDYSKLENMFLNREVTAGVFIGFDVDPQVGSMNQFIRKGFPMVIIDPAEDLIRSDQVTRIYSQNEQAGYLATSYLLRQGHRHVAHLAGDGRFSARYRLEGYERAMREAGIAEEQFLIRHGNFESDLSYDIARKLMSEYPVTAIFAVSDLTAVSAVRAAGSLGKRVPEDIAIVGCDFIPDYEELGFFLTSIKISVKELAVMSVRAALGMESDKILFCKAEFKPGSTA